MLISFTRRAPLFACLVALMLLGGLLSGASAAEEPTGSVYVPRATQCVLFDTRDTLPIRAGETRTFDLTGDLTRQGGDARCEVREDANGYHLNLVALKAAGGGNLKAWPATEHEPNGGIVNYQALTPSMNNANAFMVSFDPEGLNVKANGATVDARGILYGELIEGAVGPPGPEGPPGPQGEQGPPGEGQTINLTIDPAQFPGITAQDFDALFSDAMRNTAVLEMGGVCTGDVVYINGPAVEIEVVEGFDGQGRHDDQSGLALELPLVFEVPTGSGCDGAMQTYFDNYAAGTEGSRALSLIVKDGVGAEAFRWNLLEFVPDGYTTGLEGTRFTLVQSQAPIGVASPRRTAAIERDSGVFGATDSYNPSTDSFGVEISGVTMGLFPAIVEQTDRRLTLEYDYVEGGGLWVWVDQILELGTTGAGKKSGSVITYDPSFVEISRINYFGCFPVKYEHFTGFVQDIQTKERVILNCDWSEDAV